MRYTVLFFFEAVANGFDEVVVIGDGNGSPACVFQLGLCQLMFDVHFRRLDFRHVLVECVLGLEGDGGMKDVKHVALFQLDFFHEAVPVGLQHPVDHAVFPGPNVTVGSRLGPLGQHCRKPHDPLSVTTRYRANHMQINEISLAN